MSTHHSSPRSDYATYTNTYSNSNHAVPTSNASPPEGFASHSLQTSDVVIHRKDREFRLPLQLAQGSPVFIRIVS